MQIFSRQAVVSAQDERIRVADCDVQPVEQASVWIIALETQASAFVFVKFQMVWLLLHQGRNNECRSLADELTELGIESEELADLYEVLGRA